MLVQAGALVKGRQSGQGQTQWKRRIADSSDSSVKERGEQKNLWRKEASSQLAFRSSLMNCRSALCEERGVA